MPLTVVEKIGFFNFVEKFDEPITVLSAEVEKERANHPDRNIRNSLIVLPEAFNLGHAYGSRLPPLPACKVLGGLRQLAGVHGIAFVAGIIRGGFNSA